MKGKTGLYFYYQNIPLGTQLIVVPRRLSLAVRNLWKSWNGKNNMNIVPPGHAGLRRRRSHVIASSLCRGENWLILVDVRALSRNSTVIYPCQIVFRLRARVSPISADVREGGRVEGKKICVRYPKAIHGCHAAGCVHIIYNNNMWIHFRLHYCSVFVLNFANDTWAHWN